MLTIRTTFNQVFVVHGGLTEIGVRMSYAPHKNQVLMARIVSQNPCERPCRTKDVIAEWTGSPYDKDALLAVIFKHARTGWLDMPAILEEARHGEGGTKNL